MEESKKGDRWPLEWCCGFWSSGSGGISQSLDNFLWEAGRINIDCQV